MTTGFSLYGWLIGLGQGVLRWLFGWWTVVFIGAQLAVLAFSPSSYGAEARGAVLRQIYHAAGPGLPGFTTLMALFNVVLIRILVVTAFAYGLTQYALDAVVRVLVLELIPLIAALFVAVEYTIPGGSELYKLRRSGALQALRERGVEPLSHEVLPRVLAGLFAVLLLAALSCFLSLVLAYIALTVGAHHEGSGSARNHFQGDHHGPQCTRRCIHRPADAGCRHGSARAAHQRHRCHRCGRTPLPRPCAGGGAIPGAPTTPP